MKIVTAGDVEVRMGMPATSPSLPGPPDMRDAESRARMAPPTAEQQAALGGLCTGRNSLVPEPAREPIYNEDGRDLGTAVNGEFVNDNPDRTGGAIEVYGHSGRFGGQ